MRLSCAAAPASACNTYSLVLARRFVLSVADMVCMSCSLLSRSASVALLRVAPASTSGICWERKG